MAAEDRRCCGDPFTVAPRLGSRSRTSVSRLELVERRDQARSRGKAVLGSPFGPRGRPLHALQSSLGTLVHPCSSNLVRLNRSERNNACSGQNGASRPRERRDEFQQVPGVAQAMPWIPGTGNRPAVPLDPLAGTHSAAEQNAEQNAEQPVGYASDTRSGTLIFLVQ